MSIEDHLANIQLLDSDDNISTTSSKSDSESNAGSPNEKGIQPYNFEPHVSDFESTSSEEDNNLASSDNNIPHDLQRLQNTEW